MNRQILRLAIPNILSNLLIPLQSLVDTALMGHQVNPDILGGIALGGILFNFIYIGLGFLRMGTTGITAQAFGARNREEMRRYFQRGLWVSLMLSGVLVLLQAPIEIAGFYFMEPGGNALEFARTYFYIRIWAAPATLSLMVITGWLLGMQRAGLAMLVGLIANGMNIITSVYFVEIQHLGVAGVAWGTVIGQYTACCAGLVIIVMRFPFVLGKARGIFTTNYWQGFVRLNSDIFFRTLLLVFAFYFFTLRSANGGPLVLEANFLLIQFLTIVSYGVDGFAFAAESLVGRYIGAREADKLRKSIRLSLMWGLSLGVIIGVLYLIFQYSFLALMTSNASIISYAGQFMLFIFAACMLNGLSFIWDGIYRGAAVSRPLRDTMFISTVCLYVPAAFVLQHYFGNNGLWVAYLLFMLSRGVLLTILAPRHIYPLVKQG